MSDLFSNPKLFVAQFNTSQTLSGLDFGDKTIGIAISDKTHTIATPIMTLKRKSIKKGSGQKEIDKKFALSINYTN